MPTENTDSNGFAAGSTDTQTDMGAKGGPTTTLGNPDANHDISHPYNDDIQTQLAAGSHKKKKTDNEDVRESN